MIDFKTRGKLQEDRIVAMLESLYAGRPVGSAAIGQGVGMLHNQTLKYLHAAKKKGRVKSVEKKAGGQLAGWVPAHVQVTASVAEQRVRNAAAAVCELSVDNQPVSTSRIDTKLRAEKTAVLRWLNQAQRMGLVRSVKYHGWKPA